MNAKRHAEKARKYHGKRCQRFKNWRGDTVWRFVLDHGATPFHYTTQIFPTTYPASREER